MSNWKSCENCADTEDCWYGKDDYPFEGDCSAWTPMRCRCGGALSETRIYHYGGGPIQDLMKYDGKPYRHCYACHGEFFKEE